MAQKMTVEGAVRTFRKLATGVIPRKSDRTGREEAELEIAWQVRLEAGAKAYAEAEEAVALVDDWASQDAWKTDVAQQEVR